MYPRDSWLFEIALPAAILVFCVLAGILLQRYISLKLRAAARKTVSRWDDVLIHSFRGIIIVWSLLLGISIILSLVSLPAAVFFIARKILVIAAIISATILIGRAAAGFADVYIVRIAGVSSSIFKTFAILVVGLVGVLIVLDELGIAIAPIITALGVGGLAVALALQDTLANFFAGLHILMSRNIRPGDYIRLPSGEEGYVQDITWRNTTLRELGNNLVIIPNKKMAESILRNFHLPEKETGVLVDFKLAYGTDLTAVEQMIIEEARAVLRSTPGGVADFEPFVRFNLLGDWNIGGMVILRVTQFTDQYLVRSECIRKIRERFRREGIADPVPSGPVGFAPPGPR
jgi:small-conductance mechanosensitive channel